MVKTVNQPRLNLGGTVVPLEQAVVLLLERPGVPVLGWQKYQGMEERLYRLGGRLYRFCRENSQIWIRGELWGGNG